MTLASARLARLAAIAAAAGCALLAAGCGGHELEQVSSSRPASADLGATPPACFGAAARDPAQPCENPELGLSVVPDPLTAEEELNGPCRRFRRELDVNVCDFGVRPPEPSTRTIALVGDSHASHWRAALDVVARAKGWHGLSMTRQSCPLSAATRILPEPERTRCLRWNDALPEFLRAHPEIDTLFVGALNSGMVNIPPGRTHFEAQVNGYRRAWRRLPPSVRHIVVLRDTPRMGPGTRDCIELAIVEERAPGPACAVPFAATMRADPAVVAARLQNSPRLQVADLTPVLCSSRHCYPVIGGALVYSDHHHLTRVFAETLGPLLLRSVDELVAAWADG